MLQHPSFTSTSWFLTIYVVTVCNLVSPSSLPYLFLRIFEGSPSFFLYFFIAPFFSSPPPLYSHQQVFGSKHAIPSHSSVYDPVFDAALAKTQAEEKEAKEKEGAGADEKKEAEAEAAAAAAAAEGGKEGGETSPAKELTPVPEVPGPVIEVGKKHAISLLHLNCFLAPFFFR